MKKPILVTGSHRSGSTWVGRMLSKSPNIGYISEPFNLRTRKGICGAQFKNWFTYVCEENEADYYNHIKECLEFNYQIRLEMKNIKSIKDMLRLGRDYVSCNYKRASNKRPLMKDPIAIFSTEWLARRFNMDVIVLIRHPAAFVSSLKVKNWTYSFSNFLKQPLLMDYEIKRYASEINEYAQEEASIADQAILLWNIIYSMVLKYRERHPEWFFIKHEDLSLNPIGEYGKMFEYIGEEYSSQIQQEIIKYSSPSNPIEQGDGNLIKRASKANIWNWKKRLTIEEIERIREKTNAVASKYYDSQDWS